MPSRQPHLHTASVPPDRADTLAVFLDMPGKLRSCEGVPHSTHYLPPNHRSRAARSSSSRALPGTPPPDGGRMPLVGILSDSFAFRPTGRSVLTLNSAAKTGLVSGI